MFRLLALGIFLSFPAFGDNSQIYFDAKKKHVDSTRPYIMPIPLVSKATIGRNGENIAIDFNQPGVEKLIKDFDVIELLPGRYNNINLGNARSVILLGRGNETVIHTDKKPILVNNTEFWDVYFYDVKFKAVADEGMWAIGSEFVGDFSIEQASYDKPLRFALYTILCELSFSYMPDTIPNFGQSGEFAHLFSQRRTGTSPTLENLALYRFPRFSENSSGPLFKEFGKVLDKFSFKDGNTKLDTRIISELDFKRLHQIIDEAPSEGLNQKSLAKAMLARMGFYGFISQLVKNDADEAKYKSLITAADESMKKGNKLTALTLWGEADLLTKHTNLLEIRKLAEPVAKELNIESGCRINVMNVGSEKIGAAYQKSLYEKFPSLTSPGNCVISLSAERKSQFQKTISEVTSSRDTYQLSPAASKRLGDQARAREEAMEKALRAQEKAAQASLLAHSERMVSAAKKDEAGRLRIEGSGSDKTMTYGLGNWNGNVSAATASTMNLANEETRRQNDLAQATSHFGVGQEDLVKFKTEVDTTQVEYFNAKVSARADLHMGKLRKSFTSPSTPVESKRICYLKNYGMHMMSCNIDSVMQPVENVVSSQMSSAVIPKLEAFLTEKQKKIRAEVTTLSAKEGTALVEGILTASLIEKDHPDFSKFSSEYEKIAGYKKDWKPAIVQGMAFTE